MVLELRLAVEQKQILSQQLQESLNILSMNAQDLTDFMITEQEENPLLEIGDDEPIPSIRYDADEYDILQNIAAPVYIAPEDLLLPQIDMRGRSEREEHILRTIARAIDHNGYLLSTAEGVAAEIGVALHEVEEGIRVMQALEPAGVCASSLAECLLLQMERGGKEDTLLRRLIVECLPLLAEGRIAAISDRLGVPCSEVRARLREILALNPKPLNGLLGEPATYVVPDVRLTFECGAWTAEINDRWTERLGVDTHYMRLYRTTRDSHLRDYLGQKIRRIAFLRNATRKRRETLLMLAERLAARQSDFLLGRGALAPLTMRELAEELEVHTSTVSRAAKGKYIQSPAGICEIRQLFAGGLALTSQTGGVGREEVKQKIKALIEAEDKKKPHSDSVLASLLTLQNIEISRRTVAKYREELGLKGAHNRRWA